MLVSNLNRSSVGVQLILQAARQRGASVAALLAQAGMTESGLSDPQCWVTAPQEINLIQAFLKKYGRIAHIGLEIGCQTHLTSRGVWGFAVVSSLTFRQAAKLAGQFYGLTEFLASFQLKKEGNYYVLEVCCDHLPEEIRGFVLERDVAAWVNFTREMRPGGLPLMSVELRQDAPVEPALYQTLFSGLCPQFGAPRNAIFINRDCMDLKLSQADSSLSRMYAELCRQHIDRRRQRGGVAGKVRDLIVSQGGEIPSVDFVASRLCIAPRSLRRKLSEEGTSYRALLDEVRQTLAEQMLATGQLKLEEVAQRLGYSEPSSFVHAFKRWKGVSPAQYRRSVSAV